MPRMYTQIIWLYASLAMMYTNKSSVYNKLLGWIHEVSEYKHKLPLYLIKLHMDIVYT